MSLLLYMGLEVFADVASVDDAGFLSLDQHLLWLEISSPQPHSQSPLSSEPQLS